MTAADTVRVAWQGTSRRPLRSVLTALSLTLGVLTLVVVQSAQTLAEQVAIHRAVLRSGPATTVRVALNPDSPADQAAAQAWWLARLARLTAGQDAHLATVTDYSSIMLRDGAGEQASVDLVVASADLRAIRPFPLDAGVWFTQARLAPQVVLNRSAAGLFAISAAAKPYWVQAPQGTQAAVNGRVTVTIIGVVDDGVNSPDAYVTPDAQPALDAAGLRPISRAVLVSGAAVSRDRLANALTSIAALAERSGDIAAVSRVDTVGEYDDELATQRGLFLSIAVMCLLVGSLGILNIGLSVLRERAEELSLRRALGASRGAIVGIMMLESQIVALTAAALAVGASYIVVPWFVGRLTTIDVGSPSPPVAVLALGVLASAGAALAGAVTPSVRAARVPIATLLR